MPCCFASSFEKFFQTLDWVHFFRFHSPFSLKRSRRIEVTFLPFLVLESKIQKTEKRKSELFVVWHASFPTGRKAQKWPWLKECQRKNRVTTVFWIETFSQISKLGKMLWWEAKERWSRDIGDYYNLKGLQKRKKSEICSANRVIWYQRLAIF